VRSRPRPEELTLEELTIGAESEAAHAAAGFVLTFRLGRLFAAFRAKDAFRDRARSTGDADRERDAEDQAWLGDWGTPDGAIHVRFEKEGRGSLCGAPVHWAIEGDQLEVAVQGSVTWRGRLLATPDALDVTFESGDVLRLIPSLGQSEVEDAWMAAKRGEWRTAADRFEALLQMPSLEATQVRTLRAARIQALCALGDRATASIELDRLRRAHAESGDEASMAALAQGMLFLGQDDEVMVLLERVIPNQPADARLWSSYAALAEKVGSLQDAREATRQAIALSVAAGRRDHGFQLRNLARLHGHEGGEDDCAIHAIEAHLLDDDRPATRQLFSRWPRPFEVRLSALRRAAARVGVEPQVLGDLERLLSEAAGMDKESWIRVSRIHLERAVELCRRSGAEPILATYPFHGDMREAVVAVAADKGCALVALDDVFRRIREQDPGRQLHVADGHCNDAGYAVMAEAIGRVIVARLPPSPSRQGK
jgi:tetratricopeptide (TPR) repeat protein